ncbi:MULTISPECIES: NAD(P)-binding domain-containing protein [unclassified Streptomyces]|uniref:NADPH-dependent F420 reductase n=1 Tax=unclassified Streptomyces TaxID=2593676 RepID=UPI00036A8957|nr:MULTISPECIES: NAD(P)-binding domain-containing protein [unclassified Streptomyces]MYT33919.1 NAD(P)-binding domain-containing protein [Streptomyces sp. SID8354]
MHIAVLGTGAVGRAHAARLTTLGHQVTIGTRDVEATLARTEPDTMGTPPIQPWLTQHPGVRLAGFATAAAGAGLLINATAGHATLDALHAAGADHLAGKTLIDTAVPNDFMTSVDRPMPTLWGIPAPLLDPVGGDSLAEQIQRAFPETRVVKALNTMAAHVMVEPTALADGDHTVLLSSDHADAKQQTTDLLATYGWRDIVDLGDLTTARATEMLQPLYLALTRALGHEHHGLKVVR